jgi:hypothetical protein
MIRIERQTVTRPRLRGCVFDKLCEVLWRETPADAESCVFVDEHADRSVVTELPKDINRMEEEREVNVIDPKRCVKNEAGRVPEVKALERMTIDLVFMLTGRMNRMVRVER